MEKAASAAGEGGVSQLVGPLQPDGTQEFFGGLLRVNHLVTDPDMPRDEVRLETASSAVRIVHLVTAPNIPLRPPMASPDACPRCGHVVAVGEWPFCHGDPAEHGTPHYGWHFA